MNFLASVFFGILIAFTFFSLGEKKQWPLRKVLAYVFISDLFIALLLSLFSLKDSSASDTAIRALQRNTLRVDVGTAFVVKSSKGKNYIVTNDHVCNHIIWKDQIYARYQDGVMATGKVAKRSPAYDLCAAQTADDLDSMPIAKKSSPGDSIYTRGYPTGILTSSHGEIGSNTTWRYTFPIEEVGQCPSGFKVVKNPFSKVVEGCSYKFTSTLTSLYSRPGSSGSAVVNEKGEVVGVVSSFQPDESMEAGMVPLKQIQEFFKDL